MGLSHGNGNNLARTWRDYMPLGDFETAFLSGLKAPSWLATPSASHLLRFASPIRRSLRSTWHGSLRHLSLLQNKQRRRTHQVQRRCLFLY
ncbi:hypothetical protein EFT87_08995 [Schleiferilactobacillus harbinensis]|nr:hypothetical protein [Schleiferilactobacillus harbinensis]